MRWVLFGQPLDRQSQLGNVTTPMVSDDTNETARQALILTVQIDADADDTDHPITRPSNRRRRVVLDVDNDNAESFTGVVNSCIDVDMLDGPSRPTTLPPSQTPKARKTLDKGKRKAQAEGGLHMLIEVEVFLIHLVAFQCWPSLSMTPTAILQTYLILRLHTVANLP